MFKKLYVFVLILTMVSVANAAAVRYGPGDPPTSADGPWEDATHWTWDNVTYPGNLPGATDEARINWGGNTVTVSSTVPTVLRAQPGCDESGTIIVQSTGVLNMNEWAGIGIGGGGTGTLIIDAGGVVNTGVGVPANGHLWVAGGNNPNCLLDISGTMNVAGIIGIGTIDAVNPSGGTGTVNVLDGGLLNLSNIHGLGTSIQPGSLMQVHGTGLATLPGDFVAVAQSYIDNGQIIGAVVPVFDGMGNIIQTNIVSPEPATVILLGIGGLLIRRRRA